MLIHVATCVHKSIEWNITVTQKVSSCFENQHSERIVLSLWHHQTSTAVIGRTHTPHFTRKCIWCLHEHEQTLVVKGLWGHANAMLNTKSSIRRATFTLSCKCFLLTELCPSGNWSIQGQKWWAHFLFTPALSGQNVMNRKVLFMRTENRHLITICLYYIY